VRSDESVAKPGFVDGLKVLISLICCPARRSCTRGAKGDNPDPTWVILGVGDGGYHHALFMKTGNGFHKLSMK
jgi:hypothetical protein